MSYVAKVPAVLVVLVCLLAAGLAAAMPSRAAGPVTITLVNATGADIVVGMSTNGGGLGEAGAVAAGGSLPVTVERWAGAFWAKQGCGTPAPNACVDRSWVSLAEFNIDPADTTYTPFYNVSYVDGFTVPITIEAAGGTRLGATCGDACPGGPMLAACPGIRHLDASGATVGCGNPSLDTTSEYSAAIDQRYGTSYSWSKQDTTGKTVGLTCVTCTQFTVTFHREGPGTQPAPPNPAPANPAPANPAPANPNPAPQNPVPAPANPVPAPSVTEPAPARGPGWNGRRPGWNGGWHGHRPQHGG